MPNLNHFWVRDRPAISNAHRSSHFPLFPVVPRGKLRLDAVTLIALERTKDAQLQNDLALGFGFAAR